MEKDEMDDVPPPTAVGFFDPALKEVRRRVLYQWTRTLCILCFFVLGVLSLFWGSQYATEANYSALKFYVVDFDGIVDPYRTDNPLVGPAVTNATNNIIQSNGLHLGYEIKSPADFDNDPWKVRQAIYDEEAYGAIIVNPNATTLLRAAVTERNSSYDPTGTIESVIISARDENTYFNYILPDLTIFQATVLMEFAINPAIGFTNIDLRPFYPAVIAPAVTIGLIYLIIIAFFNFPFLMGIHAQFMKPDNHPPLKVPHWIIWRILSAIAAYFFLSLFYSLVSLSFEIPFSNDSAPDTLSATNPNGYGKGSFVVFWMLNWVGMAALGFPCENMAMILGFPWSSLFLIFWVITNVATGFYALDLAPGFYAWGYAWPLHRIVEAIRTILFDTHSRIGLDFAVLFIWIAVSLAFYPVATFIMRWKMKRGLA
ncbi:uncharacterized protein N7469_011581 [Penicillium citrinum]|uniref:DUF3533 domain-containing protein n=2 Tax=Penicillium TaxID=5073 RepID=A0A9W9NBB1_PENCI|nr:uncharacterized protein N7469_011581 [Penicillium citrinum]KAJ5216716.1 hypothetical protein N7469_011581 [Penicillium citrinum]KAJ5600937.1 hypothetical protein N7450_002004 [Penicillium hetheringtonii]